MKLTPDGIHSLIVGTSGSGKSTLAKHFAAEAMDAGDGVIVFDPLRYKWRCDYQTHDQDAFLNTFHASRDCLVVIDESGVKIGQHNEPMIETALLGRHYNHSIIFITQRAAMLSPSVRTNCQRVFVFCSGVADCKLMAEELVLPEMQNAGRFSVGQFAFIRRMQGVVKYRRLVESTIKPS